MENTTVLGVMRANVFSPNHIGNDAAIFNLTCDKLRMLGVDVKVISEDEFLKSEIKEKLIISMVRSYDSVKKMKELEADGHIVINSGIGNEQCCREKMTTLLISNNIPHPKSLILDTSENVEDYFSDEYIPCWIKRGDFHAIHREDVSYARNLEEAKSIIKEYKIRGIKRAVINEHLNGDLVKFYGVDDTDFFFWFYPFEMNHSKFGLESINGESKGYKFDEKEMRQICINAAKVLNVKVFGGDCIVGEDGTIKIIDFNDWPSFAPCRESASSYIAECIYKNFAPYLNKKTSQELLKKDGSAC